MANIIGRLGDWPTLTGGREPEGVFLPDLQRLQGRTVDLASDGQLFDGLEPANRCPHSRADLAIDLPVIEAEFR